jgi:hypothetical protein
MSLKILNVEAILAIDENFGLAKNEKTVIEENDELEIIQLN